MLVTTWNWAYLTDFSSSFKPTYLPEDNPATFSVFFDASARRTCYIAPERFVTPGQDFDENGKLNWAMDIFSVGCVIAELFTESPMFTLSQLFRYRKGEYDPMHASLTRIRDEHIRDMVAHMIQLNPDSRYSAGEYLDFWREKAFPTYFGDFMHLYMHLVTDPTSGRRPVSVDKRNSGESDDRIDRIYNDFDKISYFLGVNETPGSAYPHQRSAASFGLDLFPLEVDIPNNRHVATNNADYSRSNGALLFLNVVTSSLRTTARASTRVRGCELLLAFSETLTDDAKLDRVLPHALFLLEDKVETVQIAALRAVTQLLELVSVLSPINAFIFPRYILPRLQKLIVTDAFKSSTPLRATYATCLASFANTASRFLDMMQALRADGTLPSTDPEAEDDVSAYAAYQTLYDVTREDLVQHIEAQTKIFLTDRDPSVRRAFLGSVPSLCVFFGDSLASDLLLTHLNTYLNDDDWTLKCAFFETIVAVAAFIGGASLEDFILPLMIQALSDPEETVTEQVIRSFSSMARLGLFQRSIVLELVLIISPFSLHPNQWIREAAAQFASSAVTHLSQADTRSLVVPLLKPVLKMPSADLTELSLLDALKKPFPRAVLDMARSWAANTDKSLFWKPAQQAKNFNFGSGRTAMELYRASYASPPSRTSKSEEDEQWLTRMRNVGMRSEDEGKILALRDYIWRNMLKTSKAAPHIRHSRYDAVVSLAAEEVPLQNVLFEEDSRYYDSLIAGEPKAPNSAMDKSKPPAKLQHTASERDTRATHVSSKAVLPDPPAPTKPQDIHDGTKSRKNGLLSPQEETLSNSPNSTTSTSTTGHTHTVRHRSSAMNFLRSAEKPNKALPEIGTDATTAVGKVDAPSHDTSRIGTPQPQISRPSAVQKLHGAHSYSGGDPTVMKLLDNVYTSNYPVDIAEFGPLVHPLRKAPLTSPASHPSFSANWRPQGQLVAVLGEHSSQVTCMAVAPDHSFFITGSDDGSVRVWDTARLERNVTHRSRQVHKLAQGARVTGLCFIEQTHSFISTGSDGSLNVVKVDLSEVNGTPRYGKLRTLREWEIPSESGKDEHAVWVEHYRADGQSICIIATSLCRILALDLRTMTVLYELRNPVQHGIPTCFCLHRRRQWILLGTSHGVLDLWDLRFRLRLRAWTFRNPAPIYHMASHPSRKSTRQRVCISGGTGPGHISVWDFEKLVCNELYHTVDSLGGSRLHARDVELINLDDEKTDDASSRIAGVIALDSNFSAPTSPDNGGVRSFVIGQHIPDNGSDPKSTYLISAGPDWQVRFWNTDRIAQSVIINGAGDDRPTYSASLLGTETKLLTESAASSTQLDAGSPSKRDEGAKARMSPAGSRRSAGAGSGVRTSRYDVIKGSAQNLLRGNRDKVVCVALLERPFGMVVCADRAGLVYVFQ